ncbi:hypothetical protein, partial [Bacteroides stercorirosoris]|uniref:hypothetical protein n=1 Tax=Bacteroides stercorirosoris TaxID=871324 RepID=UPI000558DF76
CSVEAEADGVSGCPFVVDDAGGGDACREAYRYWLFTVPVPGAFSLLVQLASRARAARMLRYFILIRG